MYDARHGFATRKLAQGHDHLTIAELMRHRGGSTLAKVYAHLGRNDAHLKRALAD
jgi:integrase